MSIPISHDNNPQQAFDRHFALKCPRCALPSNITCISIPRYEFLLRFKPDSTGMVYRCDACNGPIFLRFRVVNYAPQSHKIELADQYEEVERPQESFELMYLPNEVAEDLKEALNCYSSGCFNAFAAMCRRCVQSVATDLGAIGKDKVSRQLDDLKAMAEIDDETFTLLKQIVVEGHDGAHPHLPKLNGDRAAVLLELVKDVLYQLYVRKGKLQEAMTMRTQAIRGKSGT